MFTAHMFKTEQYLERQLKHCNATRQQPKVFLTLEEAKFLKDLDEFTMDYSVEYSNNCNQLTQSQQGAEHSGNNEQHTQSQQTAESSVTSYN